MYVKYFWFLFFSFVSGLHAACTSKITFNSEFEGEKFALFVTHSADNIELDAKLFCAKFSISSESCNNVVSHHSKNCMADDELNKILFFSDPHGCQSKYLKIKTHP